MADPCSKSRRELVCPQCGQHIRLPTGKLGTITCPKCKISLLADTTGDSAIFQMSKADLPENRALKPSHLRNWRWSVGLFLVLAILSAFSYFTTHRTPVKREYVEHFLKSIGFANEATKISNRPGAYEGVENDEVRSIVDKYKQALSEAGMVDPRKLNRYYPSFGDHYKDEFITGMERFIVGFERSDWKEFLQGQMLLLQWGDWYEKNFEAISHQKLPPE